PLFAVVDAIGSALDIPLTPRRDHLDARIDRVGRELETNLIVALPRRSMRDGVAAFFSRDIHHGLRNGRTRDRGAKEVFALVDGIGAEHREDILPHELFADIGDDAFKRAGRAGLFVEAAQLFSLPDIGAEGHDFSAVTLLEPEENDRGVESAAIGEENLFGRIAHDEPKDDRASRKMQRSADTSVVVRLEAAAFGPPRTH